MEEEEEEEKLSSVAKAVPGLATLKPLVKRE
jgi:hypothetical protein